MGAAAAADSFAGVAMITAAEAAAASAAAVLIIVNTQASSSGYNWSPCYAPATFNDLIVTLISAAAAAADVNVAVPAPYIPQQPMVAAAKHFIPHSLQMLILKVLHQAYVLLLLLQQQLCLPAGLLFQLLCLVPCRAVYPCKQPLQQALPTRQHPQQHSKPLRSAVTLAVPAAAVRHGQCIRTRLPLLDMLMSCNSCV
jgi:hypothetical protein